MVAADTDVSLVLPGLPLWRRIARGLATRHVIEAASSIAFRFFLALIPLLALAGYAIGHLVRVRGVDLLATELLDVVPATAEELVYDELDRMAGVSASRSIAPVSIAIALWMGSSGAHHLMDVFETALASARRPWWRKRLLALGWVLAALVATVAVAAGALAVDSRLHPRLARQWPSVADMHLEPFERATPPAPATVVPEPTHAAHAHPARATPRGFTLGTRANNGRDVHRQLPPHLRLQRRTALKPPRSLGEHLLVVIIVLAVGVGGLTLFYRTAVPRTPGVPRRALPGALVAMGSWLLISWVFGTYVTTLGSYAVYYGSLAAVAVLLVWLLLTSIALLLGVEVNAQLELSAEGR